MLFSKTGPFKNFELHDVTSSSHVVEFLTPRVSDMSQDTRHADSNLRPDIISLGIAHKSKLGGTIGIFFRA